MSRDLEDVIREAQDRIRGRPRNWRDDLNDARASFNFRDHVAWPLFSLLCFLYAAGAVCLWIALLAGWA